ncbi:MAG: hypothetical protein D084_Lepto4C00322G0001 [Leptospirillum sp. Group IV 'UBA BS']|nr:MAG: hypothetical protein D084_Lepto4C00322G0001 [Leptospirillum sp. Group IV 'UBA BS']
MVETVNIHEAKTHLSRLLEQVSGGQEVVIAKSGKPIARLVPIQSKAISLGFLKGKLHAAKNFDRVARQTSAFMPGKDSADGKAVLEF